MARKTTKTTKTNATTAVMPIEVTNQYETSVGLCEMKTYEQFKTYISEQIAFGQYAALNTARALYFIHKNKFFEQWGFKNIEEYAESTFDIKKTAAHDCVATMEIFINEETGSLTDGWDRFGFTQLSEIGRGIRYISKHYDDAEIVIEDVLKEITPEDSAKTIRAIFADMKISKSGGPGEAIKEPPLDEDSVAVLNKIVDDEKSGRPEKSEEEFTAAPETSAETYAIEKILKSVQYKQLPKSKCVECSMEMPNDIIVNEYVMETVIEELSKNIGIALVNDGQILLKIRK